MSIEVKVALPTRCVLGEGLHWDQQRNLLWFVDIHGHFVYWFDPQTHEAGGRAMPEAVGWILSVESLERLLVGLRSGIALFDPFDSSASLEWVNRGFPTDPAHRLNDAKADQRGRLWYGSVNASDESQSVGCLARYEWGTAGPVVVDSGYRVPNGPAFNRDGSIMLHSDSALRIIYRHDIDVETGAIVRRTVWKQLIEGEGFPDGMNFDSDGCVWIAHWGASKICRYDARGNILLTIPIPTTNVTNICFAGTDMDRMFVTSATHGLSEAQRRAEPAAGFLFEITGVGVRGLPSWQLRR